MTMNTLALSPLFRHSVGFDHLDRVFDRVFSSESASPSYPPYNIEKLGEDSYRITMAVAGFKQQDLSIVAHGDTLTVSGKIQEKEEGEGVSYLHRGIATRAFERRFTLADYVKVESASLEDGLLRISLLREIPEAAKPKIINIQNGGGAKEVPTH